jgi:hypothetical protein
MLPKKPKVDGRCQWCMPVILAIQEAEIRRMEVQSQPWQLVAQAVRGLA